MYYRVNENNEIIDAAPGYYEGYHADIEPKLDQASEEQKRLYAIPEHELAKLSGDMPGPLFTDRGTPRYIASGGFIEENPDAVREEAVRSVSAAFDAAVAPLLDKYPAGESAAFPIKRALAYQWKALGEMDKKAALEKKEFLLLAVEAAAIPDVADVDALADGIIENAERFALHSGLCLRIKKKLTEMIEASPGSRKAVDAILADMVFPGTE